MAVVCRALDDWDADKAEQFLKQAGTSPDYAGLFRDVRGFKQPTAEALARIPSTFAESVKTDDLVDAMVSIDENFDWLKAAQKVAWKEIPKHPALTPAQASTLVWEQMREQLRSPETRKRGDDYEKQLIEAEKTMDALRQLLGNPAGDAAARDAAFQAASKSCTTCHKAHRN